MSSNFHNLWGMYLVGLEFHDYVPGAGPAMTSHPHATGQFWFLQPMATLFKKADRVTAETWSMLQQGYDFYLIPHCPLPLPPPGGPTAPVLGKVIATSGSKLQMAVLSVTSGGSPLACCISSMFSANQNCSDPMDVELNAVMNLNSVETTPTAGDYAAAIASGLVDKAMAAAFGWALGKTTNPWKKQKPPDTMVEPPNPKVELVEDISKQVWRRAPDAMKFLEAPTSKTSEFVKQMVDGGSS